MSENMRCSPLSFGNIFIRFGSKLYRQIVGIPISTDCAPLVADLFLFGYERDWCLTVSLSLSHSYPRSGVVLDCIDF